MKKTFLLVILVLAAVASFSAPCFAFTHYTQNGFTTAVSLDPGMTQTGIQYSLGDQYRSYYPEIRYGLGALFEFGAKFGVVDISHSDTLGALVGIDLKYQLIKEAEGIPIDLAVDLAFDNVIVNSKNASELTFATIASKSYALTDRGYKFTPYGGLAMTTVYGSLPPRQDNFVNLIAGFEWKLSSKFAVLMELKAGDQTTGGVGIRFEY
jgi:hypothetical protein